MNHLRAGRLTGFLIAGAAALMLVSVPLPWVSMTVHLPPVISVPGGPTFATSGLGNGQGPTWGWLVLACALAALAIGVADGALKRGWLAAAAGVPAVAALPGLGVMAVRVLSGAAAFSASAPELPAVLSPVLRASVLHNAGFSLGIGWYLAAAMTLLVIALSVAGLALCLWPGRRSAPFVR